jgi:N-terminal half of MaoC dehydratase
MAVDPELEGRTFPPTAPYVVSREKIAEFASAIGAEAHDGGDTAPLTFPIVVAFRAMTELMACPEVGIDLHNVVHGEQRFEQTRPVRAGDELVATLTIDSIRAGGGVDMIGTRSEITTTSGDHVSSAFALLVHRGGRP